MLPRETSIEAFREIKENGLLSHRRMQVYEYVFTYGPCTARECHKYYTKAGTNSSSIMSRFSELREMGVLKEIGHKKDEETGMTVILWDVTSKLPKKIKKTKYDRLECSYCSGKGYVEQGNLI